MTAAPIEYVLAEFADTVAAQFKARGVPCWVRFGTKRYDSGLKTENEIVIREAPNGDTFADTPRAGGNPQPLALCNCGATAEITGRSTAAGADVTQHRYVVKQLLHQLVAALLYAEHEAGAPVAFGRGGYVDDPKQSSEYGARYVLSFSVPEVICSATTWNTSTADTGYTVGLYLGEGAGEELACSHEEPPPPPPEEPDP